METLVLRRKSFELNIKNISYVTQWAAVRTRSSRISVPPHKSPLKNTIACHGQFSGDAEWPPNTLVVLGRSMLCVPLAERFSDFKFT